MNKAGHLREINHILDNYSEIEVKNKFAMSKELYWKLKADDPDKFTPKELAMVYEHLKRRK